MKRLLSICLLMVCLCLPVAAGHNIIGGWCTCGTDPGFCFCDPGEEPRGNASEPTEKDADFGSGTLLLLAALLLALRYKA